MIVSETYSIQDITQYIDELTHTSSGSSERHVQLTNNTFQLPTDFEITFNAKIFDKTRIMLGNMSNISGGEMNYCFGFDCSGGNVFHLLYRDTTTHVVATLGNGDSNYHAIKIVRENGTVSWYFDNVLKGTTTLSWLDNYSYAVTSDCWASGTFYLQNLKVKPL